MKAPTPRITLEFTRTNHHRKAAERGSGSRHWRMSTDIRSDGRNHLTPLP
jgi:hypothetical protein